MALSYGVVEGWEQLPTGYSHRDVAGVAIDGEDRVYLICRGDHPIIVYDRKGNFLGSWGEGQFTPQGKLLLTLGTMNKPSDTGYDGKNTATVSKAGGPFNRPTNLAVGPK